MKLTSSQKEAIRSILRRLGGRQKELAAKMGYATGNLSEFLNPTKDKGVTLETWTKLLDALDTMAEARPQLCENDPAILEELITFRQWEAGTEEEPNDAPFEVSMRLYPPTGPLPLDALNYVPRRADGLIQEIIDHPGPRSVLVQGGIGTGRSSWLL